jgi:ABC-2 type transport system ATP-binding protein
MPAEAAIEVVDACKAIDGLTVLDRVSFTVRPGRVTALLGPNGAGKSSLLRALLGVDRLDAGQALIGGRPLHQHDRPLEVVGGLLDADGAHPRRSSRGHLEVVAASNALPRSSVTWALELVGMAELADLPFRQLSLGMRQRLGLATALLGQPAAVVLDEPHNGLDAAAIRWMRTLLRGLAAAGRSVLVSSHLLGEVEAVCDDVVVLHQGRVLAAQALPDFLAGSSLEERYLALVAEP